MKSLREPPRPGVIGTADLHVACMTDLLKRTAADWDRRAHRLGVLAEATAGTDVPSLPCRHPKRL